MHDYCELPGNDIVVVPGNFGPCSMSITRVDRTTARFLVPRSLDRSSHIGALDSRARAVPATSDYAHNGGA